ncbi:centrosomal protein of 112 kDa [Halyomorpha halys]|uniref:centrosomal protein of 112 kDa n=1 Tax=Halyomorpha halys TaxID=286706 RepID=UPI0006D52926|nr:centrosomal protein of 112 kDa-like [Halyomorpha halys]
MSCKDVEEFQVAVKEIAYTSLNLASEYDRVRCAEWVRKLSGIATDNLEACKVRNDYIQYLKITLRSGLLHGIFMHLPPEGDLKPLAEHLGQEIVKLIPSLSDVGPIAPFMKYQSQDGKAYVSIKKIGGKGVFCYMAVSPDGV